jgi:hypothetical protein
LTLGVPSIWRSATAKLQKSGSLEDGIMQTAKTCCEERPDNISEETFRELKEEEDSAD